MIDLRSKEWSFMINKNQSNLCDWLATNNKFIDVVDVHLTTTVGITTQSHSQSQPYYQ